MKQKRLVCLMMVMAMMVCSLSSLQGVTAAKKASIKKKSFVVTVGQSKTIVLKNKKKKATYSFVSSNKKIVSVNKKGLFKARKAGKAKINVIEKIKNSKKKIGTVTVKVNKKKSSTSTTPTPTPTSTPDVTEESYDVPDGFDSTVSGVDYGKTSVISYYSTTTKTNRKANVILPAGYSTSEKYPVLYLLHGIGGDHNEWLSGNPAQVIGNLVSKGEAKKMIIVIPNVRCRANDSASSSDIFTLANFQAFDNFINDLRDNLMPYINENYSAATGRSNTAIAGLSMGGRESLYIGFTMPETFGYIGAFCPAPGILAYTMNGVTESGLFTKATFKLSDEYNKKTKVMIVAGKSDTVVGTNPVDYHNALTANKTEHIYYVTEGGHDFNVWKNGLYNFAKRAFK